MDIAIPFADELVFLSIKHVERNSFSSVSHIDRDFADRILTQGSTLSFGLSDLGITHLDLPKKKSLLFFFGIIQSRTVG